MAPTGNMVPPPWPQTEKEALVLLVSLYPPEVSYPPQARIQGQESEPESRGWAGDPTHQPANP